MGEAEIAGSDPLLRDAEDHVRDLQHAARERDDAVCRDHMKKTVWLIRRQEHHSAVIDRLEQALAAIQRDLPAMLAKHIEPAMREIARAREAAAQGKPAPSGTVSGRWLGLEWRNCSPVSLVSFGVVVVLLLAVGGFGIASQRSAARQVELVASRLTDLEASSQAMLRRTSLEPGVHQDRQPAKETRQ